jgi:hypothetical protein
METFILFLLAVTSKYFSLEQQRLKSLRHIDIRHTQSKFIDCKNTANCEFLVTIVTNKKQTESRSFKKR